MVGQSKTLSHITMALNEQWGRDDTPFPCYPYRSSYNMISATSFQNVPGNSILDAFFNFVGKLPHLGVELFKGGILVFAWDGWELEFGEKVVDLDVGILHVVDDNLGLFFDGDDGIRFEQAANIAPEVCAFFLRWRGLMQ